jgi:mono/diheme cytochrome c family protein
MIRFTHLVLAAGAALLIAGSAAAQQAGGQPTAPAGNADNGKKLFLADGCWQCHGYAGQGSSFSGPRVAPPVPFQAFLTQLRRPSSEMPPYEVPVLSDQQAADIYSYLQSLPKPPDPKTIPLLGG